MVDILGENGFAYWQRVDEWPACKDCWRRLHEWKWPFSIVNRKKIKLHDSCCSEKHSRKSDSWKKNVGMLAWLLKYAKGIL